MPANAKTRTGHRSGMAPHKPQCWKRGRKKPLSGRSSATTPPPLPAPENPATAGPEPGGSCPKQRPGQGLHPVRARIPRPCSAWCDGGMNHAGSGQCADLRGAPARTGNRAARSDRSRPRDKHRIKCIRQQCPRAALLWRGWGGGLHAIMSSGEIRNRPSTDTRGCPWVPLPSSTRPPCPALHFRTARPCVCFKP